MAVRTDTSIHQCGTAHLCIALRIESQPGDGIEMRRMELPNVDVERNDVHAVLCVYGRDPVFPTDMDGEIPKLQISTHQRVVGIRMRSEMHMINCARYTRSCVSSRKRRTTNDAMRASLKWATRCSRTIRLKGARNCARHGGDLSKLWKKHNPVSYTLASLTTGRVNTEHTNIN